MLPKLADFLRCPLTGNLLQLQAIRTASKIFREGTETVIEEGILRSGTTIFPIVKGVPRCLPESFLEHEDFLKKHVADYEKVRDQMLDLYVDVIWSSLKKNERTKKSFSQEWNLFNYSEDKVWAMGSEGLLDRFLAEVNESGESLQGKMILDVGCGNGLLNQYIGDAGASVIGIDISLSIERAAQINGSKNAFFIQADMQHPPLPHRFFDIVHASGSLHHTNNTEFSFSCIEPLVRAGGKLSVWLYHPSKDRIHNIINATRQYTSRLPLKLQMAFYKTIVFPLAYVVKRAKSNKQNTREMMVDIMDWLSPEFRWEHTEEEVRGWFLERKFHDVRKTTSDRWGFSMVGIRNEVVKGVKDPSI